MVHRIVVFFDKLEDKIRIRLSHKPILYSIIGGIGIVLFWKGVWETAELFPVLYGPVSVVLGTVILLLTGLMVSFFIGDSIIISGFKKEKKLVEKTESEVASEQYEMSYIAAELEHIEDELADMRKHTK
ncbi:MAG: hypothetical protein JWM46_680 [Candidatus Kaiserbacteria bacterium]|nr:hypothetical protein [Candidatus Kaiserbacteria bacterium]